MKVNAVHPQKGDTMNTIRAGTGYPPSIVKIKFIDIHTAVFDGIAVFFHSTHFFLFPMHSRKSNYIFNESTSALWRVRFFFIIKSLFLTFYCSRAPPFSLEFLDFKNFKTGGNQNEN